MTIKAKMSDGAGRAFAFRKLSNLRNAPVEAEREVRAILAETEPETCYSSTFSPVSMYKPHSTQSVRGRMHAALAEALEAFISKEE